MEEDFTWDFKYDIKDYIEGEKDFIKQDMQTQFSQGIDPRGLEKDLAYLESLDDKDIDNITRKVFYDESLNETFNDLVHYYLYHYDKYIKGGDINE